jgi:hypothetical protein
MPDREPPEADDSDSLLEDDEPGPPDGWGGKE